MKSLKFFSSVRAALRSKEARILGVLLLREALMLSLLSLALFLSLESILPGTVSLRTSILAFLIGIAFALLAEQALSKTLPPLETKQTHAKKRPLFIGLFLVWSAFLIGNSLFGFHVGIIALLLLITLPLLWIFFGLRESAH